MADLYAVETTDPKYNILTHVPTGATFDKDGRSMWPKDQFAVRLIAEGSVRFVEAQDDSAEDENASASAKSSASAKE